ncbi:hypothetical protein VNI00_005172 [Paramarasmius palmivorus]|uniref:Alcohol acetyltransferase n=1 Tax=Paramarasmius palmivorus TaxID=297713 RepID=A0AAW0DH79_9AGAR
MSDLQDYIFTPLPGDESVWARKCYGLESFASTMSENLDGFPFLTTTISIKPAYDRETLEPAVKAAWIALRHSLPAIAVKSSRLSAPDNRFTLTYHVPKNLEQVQEWANETLFFAEEMQNVYEVHRKLKDERWWKPANGHWVGELHVSPIEDGWQFSVVFNHNSNDGRSGFVSDIKDYPANDMLSKGLLNELLAKLVPILQGSAKPVSELPWGEETKRLPPASNIINAQANAYPKKDQAPPVLPNLVRSLRLERSTSVLTRLFSKTPWTWPPVEVTPFTPRDISTLVTLPVETTSKLHTISKAHGRTISQVVTALSILAHAEISLAAAAKAGPERFNVVSKSFKESEVYKIAFTFTNYRHQFPDPYKSLSSETPGPLSTFDGMPLFLPMAPIRKFFTVDDAASTASANSADLTAAFWDELVEATAKSWKEYDLSLQGFATREEASQGIIHNFDKNILHVPALVTSSIGDLGRLHIFDEYQPSRGNKTLTVIDAICGQRMRVPAIMNLFWQYDGKLSCQWFTGGEWTTEKELQEVVEAFRRWIGTFIGQVGRSNPEPRGYPKQVRT